MAGLFALGVNMDTLEQAVRKLTSDDLQAYLAYLFCIQNAPEYT
jgi:hypothetical protein